MTELEQLCENALYDEMRVLEDGKSVVRDIPTGKLYFKKTLDVYNEHVYAFLKDHRNKNVAGVQTYWKDGDKLVVIEELIQGRTLDEILQEEASASAGPANDKVPDEAPDSETTADKDSANAAANAPDRPIAPALTFSERIDILAQICDGLQFLHSADPPIIHRDIKASNIMVTDDGVVKIIDYDAAKIYTAGQDKDTMMIGTQGLAAPEQYGFAQSNVRTDLYALGKLIERMLPDNVDAKRIVEKATEMDPKKRYTSAAQMKSQIQKIREKPAFLDQKFEKIPGFDPMNKSHRTRARIALAAAALAVLLLAGALGWRIMVYPVRQEEALRAELSVISASEAKDGQLTTPDSIAYKALLIANKAHVSAESQAQIEAFRKAGVSILRSGENIVRPLEILTHRESVAHTHRKTCFGELFYLANLEDTATTVRFRLQDKPRKVNIWHNLTGRHSKLKSEASGTFSLTLQPCESVFLTYE